MMVSSLASGIFFPASLRLGTVVLAPEQVIFGVGGVMRWLSIIPLAFVVERKGVPLRRALSASLAYALQRINCYWNDRFKRG